MLTCSSINRLSYQMEGHWQTTKQNPIFATNSLLFLDLVRRIVWKMVPIVHPRGDIAYIPSHSPIVSCICTLSFILRKIFLFFFLVRLLVHYALGRNHSGGRRLVECPADHVLQGCSYSYLFFSCILSNAKRLGRSRQMMSHPLHRVNNPRPLV